MSLPDIINQFQFPAEALEDFQRMGMTQRVLRSDNAGVVSEFQFCGHDRGIPFMFDIYVDKNGIKSEDAGIEINDEIEIIRWHVGKGRKPVERVHMLPEQLLKFKKVKVTTKVGDRMESQMVTKFPLECIGGQYMPEYLRWKQGLGSQGLELSRWNKLTLGQVKTLQSEGIYTVEQFAAMDKQRVEDPHFPRSLKEAYQHAVHFVAGQSPMEAIKDNAEEMLILRQEIAKLKDANTILEERTRELIQESEPPRKRGRPKKVVEGFELSEEAA